MRSDCETTIAPSEITATSLVPPPTSTTMLPLGPPISSPPPIAAAIGSSIRVTSRAPAERHASSRARVSTSVIPEGAHITTRGCAKRCPSTLWMKWRSICSVTSKSAITPCRSGRLAEIVAGVRPIIRFASSPTAYTLPLLESVATTEGSESTIPRPRTYTSVFAVPRSIARSRPALLSEERKLSGSAGGKRRGERRPVDVVAPTVAVSGRVPGEVDGEYRGKARVGRAPVTGDRVRAYVVAVGVGVDVEGRAGRGRDAVGDAVVRDRDSERAVARD